jgi:hypothetical protein
MSISPWLPWTFSRSQARRGRPRNSASRRKRARLFLEHLEDRALLTSFTALTVSALIADINAANTTGGSNTITLTAPTTSPYVLTAVNNTTSGANGLPVIAANDSLTIAGSGDTIERSAASGTPSFRLLDVAAGASLTLGNMTLQGGLASGSGISADGGAIDTQGALTLNGVTVQNNIAQGAPATRASAGQNAAGGGIYSSASLTLEGSTKVQHNQALGGGSVGLMVVQGRAPSGGNGSGGGLYVAGGTATLTSVTLSSNTAQGGQGVGTNSSGGTGGTGGTAFGGALGVAGGTVTLTTNTLSSNVAQGGQGGSASAGYGGHGGNGLGGALQVSGGTVSVSNAALSSNTTQGGNGGTGSIIGGLGSTNGGVGGNGFGGGLEVAGGTVTLISVTVTTNHAYGGSNAPSAGAGLPQLSFAEGGGLYIASMATVYIDPFTLAHVISNIASPPGSQIGSYPNIFGTYIEK